MSFCIFCDKPTSAQDLVYCECGRIHKECLLLSRTEYSDPDDVAGKLWTCPECKSAYLINPLDRAEARPAQRQAVILIAAAVLFWYVVSVGIVLIVSRKTNLMDAAVRVDAAELIRQTSMTIIIISIPVVFIIEWMYIGFRCRLPNLIRLYTAQLFPVDHIPTMPRAFVPRIHKQLEEAVEDVKPDPIV